MLHNLPITSACVLDQLTVLLNFFTISITKIIILLLTSTLLSSLNILLGWFPETLMKSFYWTILRYGNIVWGFLNGSNCPEDVRTLDACASNNGVAKHMKPKKLIELNGEIQKYTITIRGCNTHFLAIARTAAQKKSERI